MPAAGAAALSLRAAADALTLSSASRRHRMSDRRFISDRRAALRASFSSCSLFGPCCPCCPCCPCSAVPEAGAEETEETEETEEEEDLNLSSNSSTDASFFLQALMSRRTPSAVSRSLEPPRALLASPGPDPQPAEGGAAAAAPAPAPVPAAAVAAVADEDEEEEEKGEEEKGAEWSSR